VHALDFLPKRCLAAASGQRKNRAFTDGKPSEAFQIGFSVRHRGDSLRFCRRFDQPNPFRRPQKPRAAANAMTATANPAPQRPFRSRLRKHDANTNNANSKLLVMDDERHQVEANTNAAQRRRPGPNFRTRPDKGTSGYGQTFPACALKQMTAARKSNRDNRLVTRTTANRLADHFKAWPAFETWRVRITLHLDAAGFHRPFAPRADWRILLGFSHRVDSRNESPARRNTKPVGSLAITGFPLG
jgi:hypothetical protein